MWKQAPWVAVLLVGLLASPARAAVVFQLDLPLVDQQSTQTAITPYGGTITGGQFSANGWTTTGRSDLILVPLPAGLDTRQGTVIFSVTGFEWNVTSTDWEQWALVAIDSHGPPLGQGSTGDAQVMSLYRGYNPDTTKGYHLTAYFNLLDPACTDWHNCTAECKTPHFWLQQSGVTYTIEQAWQDQEDVVTFTGASSVVRTMDLSQTSSGLIGGAQLYLMINACGGSTHNQCGPWDGPTNLKGGPIGVTYADLTLEIYGPDPPDAGVGTDAGSSPDAGASPDAAAPDSAAADAAVSDAATPDGAAPDARPNVDAETDPPGSQARGGCTCQGSSSPDGSPLLLLLLILWVARKRR